MKKHTKAGPTMIEPYQMIEDALWKIGLTNWRMYEYVMSGVYVKGGLTKDAYYTIDIKDYAEYFNIDYHSAYLTLRKDIKKIAWVQLPQRIFKEEANLSSYVEFQIFSELRYSLEDKGILMVQLHPRVEQLYKIMHDEKTGYSKYPISNTRYMCNEQHIRLFRLMNKWASVRQVTYTLEELKVLLGLDETQYERYGDFNSKVLSPAIEEINRDTYLDVTIATIKSGRKVLAVKFKINRKGKVDGTWGEI